MSDNEVARTLDKARALIEKGWTQGDYATTVTGYPIGPNEKAAVCFCATGALWRVSSQPVFEQAAEALNTVVGRNIFKWNDAPERTQAEVVQAFKEAAALARAGAL